MMELFKLSMFPMQVGMSLWRIVSGNVAIMFSPRKRGFDARGFAPGADHDVFPTQAGI